MPVLKLLNEKNRRSSSDLLLYLSLVHSVPAPCMDVLLPSFRSLKLQASKTTVLTLFGSYLCPELHLRLVQKPSGPAASRWSSGLVGTHGWTKKKTSQTQTQLTICFMRLMVKLFIYS